ncbi:uncharacterized protein LACBIDRAFT_305484 [Laccaria bicolor S238N-H82]|uniref:Predicted protein n=1 Tax=Laccaria bicolor (strain S238N-H82 / ATCC MYA-4686) TaxID=486041 RepID=B0CUC5_LACBS|nr:uncharacterized protein LACBIDRAFT_305484 [Laccaria bicolor S238N-H82]EDR14071.1 predicted protein [Laccaria bicolor S238N-H82]|eukprot:XP_001874630.1 predicted protein [Laccaria bicolor S238N-H82]
MLGYHLRIVVKSSSQSQESFIPTSLFQRFPAHSQKSIHQPSKTPHHSNDYRFGSLTIDWVDMERGSQPYSPWIEKGRGKGHAEATFVPQTRKKVGTTNLPEGTVHIFRDCTNIPSLTVLEAMASSLPVDTDGVMLAVLAVPSWMTPSDFLAFVAPAVDGMAHLRIIRDFAPNRSIAVVKFLSPANAAEFAEAYNGKPFNSIEPEICHVVHVLSIAIDVEDPVSQAISRTGGSHLTMYELPTCPVCLERMDSAVTGLITVPCSHTFHCMCLSKWGDSRCPVCRYSQNLLSSHPTSILSSRSLPFTNPTATPLSSCSSCPSTTNLWICLICGNIGCGRYGQAHAQAHYQGTTHLYALELETQRVWDYAGDGYVHRLIQNKADGKLVELPSAASSMGVTPRDGSLGPSQADALSAEKIEAIGIEYSYLLSSQLDSQRSFYEDQTTELTAQVIDLRGLIERLSFDFEADRKLAKEEAERKQKEDEEKLAQIMKEKARAEHKAEKATELARKFGNELREERAVSDGLMKNLAVMKERMELIDKQKDEYTRKVEELEDQVRDVMFFLEAKTKIEHGGGVEAEAAGGTVEVPVASTAQKLKGKKKISQKG